MTYRERREARAARLREWAEKRESAATATLQSQPELRHDWAFITQPGHIPERSRMIARDERAYESLAKAASMESRASGIESQLGRAIYSDDPDAIEALAARIAALEAKREAYKASNKTRKAAGQLILPAYVLTNLSADIRRNKQRLDGLKGKDLYR